MLDPMLRALAVVATLAPVLWSRGAVADPDPAATQAAMNEYFASEKTGGSTLIAMGIGGLALGSTLFVAPRVVDDPDLGAAGRGMSYPLLGVGVLHIAAGLFVRASSNNR